MVYPFDIIRVLLASSLPVVVKSTLHEPIEKKEKKNLSHEALVVVDPTYRRTNNSTVDYSYAYELTECPLEFFRVALFNN